MFTDPVAVPGWALAIAGTANIAADAIAPSASFRSLMSLISLLVMPLLDVEYGLAA
jgi:hypothetical protein